MLKEEAKEELKKRYIYLKENVNAIFACTISDNADIKKRYPGSALDDDSKYYVTISPYDELMQLIESLLLQDGELEQTNGYTYFEYLKSCNGYEEFIDSQLGKLEKYNAQTSCELLKKRLTVFTILVELHLYIDNQSGDTNNRDNKLAALDEYFRIARFRNDGKIWMSGYDTVVNDVLQYDNYSSILLPKHTPTREKEDIGLTSNDYIKTLASNFMILSEEEKKEIYLMFHKQTSLEEKPKVLSKEKDNNK